MKAAIYNPYLDSLGGGERYTMAVAQILAKHGYRVDVEWNDPKIKTKIETRFGVNLGGINFISDIKKGESYDICFWVSDGSIPTLRARNNILHFQIPFHDVKGNTLLNKMKLFRIKHIVCNSFFTKSFIDREYGVRSEVLYPPVSVDKIRPGKKENIILSVGRFSTVERSKRQDVLVSSFKRFFDSGNKNWKLVLCGGADVGVGEYIKSLRASATGYPIRIIESPSFKDLLSLYKSAKIFWFASGFSVDQVKNPEKLEHFGIVVVEAMAAGAVPIIFNAGGHREIIDNSVNGFLWDTQQELLTNTQKLVDDNKLYKDISKSAHEQSAKYSYDRFEERLLEII